MRCLSFSVLTVLVLLACSVPCLAQVDYAAGGQVLQTEVLNVLAANQTALYTIFGVVFAILLLVKLIFSIPKV